MATLLCVSSLFLLLRVHIQILPKKPKPIVCVMASVATLAMNSLLSKLASLVGEEYKLLKGVKKDIAFLRDEMISMNAALEVLAGKDDLDNQEKEWRNQVQDLAYIIEDCVDIFMHQLGRADANPGILQKITQPLKTLIESHHVANRIQKLKVFAVDVKERRSRYELIGRVDGPSGVGIDPRLRALYEEATNLVGIDGPQEDIIRRLMLEGPQELKVVSIVGFGGMGKTTLANQVYCKIKQQFKCTAFVSASRSPNMLKILADLLSKLGFGNAGIPNDEQQLIDNLRDYLQNSRYLIVIDDIWSIEAWNIIKCVFVKNNLGSRVITTTRIEQVAVECCCYSHEDVHQIKALNDLESRRLFLRRLFYPEHVCPEQFKSVSEEILKKCGGVPLAIISVASILAGQEMKVENWKRIQKSLGFELETNPTLEWMRHVLNLSYNDLSPALKTCLLYFSTFPEDSVIRKDDLVRQWIAEGFVSGTRGLNQEEIAENYFNHLINRNVVQPVNFDDCGELVSCRVHDLMLEFIITKSSEANFITIIYDQQSMEGCFKVRRLSFRFSNEHNIVPTSMVLSQTRSLYLLVPVQRLPSLSMFQHLRVLHLIAHDSERKHHDLTIISKFFLLRYLRIGGISCTLPHIRGLQYLMTMEVDGKVQNFPSDVCDVSSLSHLIAPADVKLPNGIGNMRALRTLKGFNVAESSLDSVHGLGKLSSLKELEIYYEPNVEDLVTKFSPKKDNSRKVKDLENSLASSLCKLGTCNLRSLIFRSDMYPIESFIWSLRTTDVLSGWSPPPEHLHRLHALQLPFSRVPKWIAQLDSLTSLELAVEHLSMDGFNVLAQLPSLLHLGLQLLTEQEEKVVTCSNTFPCLKEFWFECFAPFLTFEPGAMSKLQTLDMQFPVDRVRNHVGSILDGIEHLPSLKLCSARIREPVDVLVLCSVLSHGKEAFLAAKAAKLVSAAEAAVRNARHKHPGSPTITIDLPSHIVKWLS